MRFNPKANLDRGRVSDSGRGGGGGGLGGGGMRMPIPGGMKAGGGIGTLIIVVLVVALSQCMGGGLIGGGGTSSSSAFDTDRVASSDSERYANCKTGEDANNDPDCQRIAVENSLVDYWQTALPDQSGTDFQAATMQTFSGQVSTGCGGANSAVGPFYCPPDQTIYLDTTFFDEVLERQLGGPDGGFVEPYVLAHEYGHHIQNLLGAMGRVKTQQGPTSDAVRLELQADCYAGMWAAAAPEATDANGEHIITDITQADVQQAIEAAEAVGDDRIQQKAQGQVTPEGFTHGTAEQRARWFQTGFQQGTLQACDTWAARQL